MLLAWFDIAEGLVHHDHEVIRHEHVLGDAGVGACALHAGDIPAILDFELAERSEEHTSELQSLMRISYAVFCLKKKKYNKKTRHDTHTCISQDIHITIIQASIL